MCCKVYIFEKVGMSPTNSLSQSFLSMTIPKNKVSYDSGWLWDQVAFPVANQQVSLFGSDQFFSFNIREEPLQLLWCNCVVDLCNVL